MVKIMLLNNNYQYIDKFHYLLILKVYLYMFEQDLKNLNKDIYLDKKYNLITLN